MEMSRKDIFNYSIVTIVVILILAWAATLNTSKSAFIKVVIPPGLRKEEIGDILAKDMQWTEAEKQQWTAVTSSTTPDHLEGVYFPDTYLIPRDESPATTSQRLIADFNEKFAPYAKEAAQQNIKWTTVLTLASIIQREAAGPNDMSLISGILWNRLNAKIPLDVDSTVQYARGDTPTGWWAPLAVSNLKIDSPYNTYLNKGLPPHPIDDPGLPAINAALNPASTTCIYYIHDSSRNIHCSDTYAGQEANVKEYLQ